MLEISFIYYACEPPKNPREWLSQWVNNVILGRDFAYIDITLINNLINEMVFSSIF